MLQQFLNIFITYAGATAGILSIILPIGVGGYIAYQVYTRLLLARWEKEARRVMAEKVKEMQEESTGDANETPPWVSPNL